MRASRYGFLLLSVSLILVTGRARADDLGELKRRGDEALVSGRAAEALAFYKKVYEERKDPALLYNMGRALQSAGDYPQALEHLEQFERDAGPELRAKVPGLAGLIAEVKRKVAYVTIVCDVPGATVRLDDRTIGTTPLGKPRALNAGSAKLLITKEGYYDYKREIVLPAGGSANVEAHLSSKATEGVLLVKSPVVGASVSIDGKPTGTVPTELVLKQGPHRVELQRDGYRPASSSVIVNAGEKREVDIGLEKEAPITKKWWFWTGVGLAVVGGTVAVIALTTEKDPGTGTLAPGRISAGLSF